MGISDFTRLVREHYYYVDKTKFIPRMEMTSSYLFLVRPRRFGKSLFLSMLRMYYDVNQKDRFGEYFGDLWIGSHPTPQQGRYAVLHLDFSLVTGVIEELAQRFNQYCSMITDGFGEEYEHLFYPGFAQDVKQQADANGKINFIGYKAKIHGVPLYLIIDEYDNFTNTVLNQHGEDIYTSLTHGEGFYRDIFKLFKPNFERVLMLGVSPVTMDDLTSGYNIATNITADAAFNQMLGFSEEEVRQMFHYYLDAGWIHGDVEAMLDEMRPWYDNYCFAKESLMKESKVYNSNMVLYYLSNQVRNGSSPEEMNDPKDEEAYPAGQAGAAAQGHHLPDSGGGLYRQHHRPLLPRLGDGEVRQLRIPALLLWYADDQRHTRQQTPPWHPEQQRAQAVLWLPAGGVRPHPSFRPPAH